MPDIGKCTHRRGEQKFAVGCYAYGYILVAGTVYAPDSYTIPTLIAHWIYKGVKQGVRKLERLGIVV